jgi:hypothetical protein
LDLFYGQVSIESADSSSEFVILPSITSSALQYRTEKYPPRADSKSIHGDDCQRATTKVGQKARRWNHPPASEQKRRQSDVKDCLHGRITCNSLFSDPGFHDLQICHHFWCAFFMGFDPTCDANLLDCNKESVESWIEKPGGDLICLNDSMNWFQACTNWRIYSVIVSLQSSEWIGIATSRFNFEFRSSRIGIPWNQSICVS